MKKNSIILTGLAIIAAMGTFTFNMVGCSGDSNESKEMEQVTLQKKMVSPERLLSDEQVKIVGEMYNFVLIDVFNDYDFRVNDRVSEFKRQFDNLDLKGYKIDWSKKDYGDIENEISFLKENISNDAFEIIEKAVKEMEGFEGFDEYLDCLNSLELEARSKLIGVELDAILISLNVFENSSKFWLHVDDGGMGIGWNFAEEYNNVYNKEISSIRQTIKTALAADGLSAASGFIIGAGVLAVSVGSGGLATPAIVAFLVGIAAESAVASAVAIGIDIN